MSSMEGLVVGGVGGRHLRLSDDLVPADLWDRMTPMLPPRPPRRRRYPGQLPVDGWPPCGELSVTDRGGQVLHAGVRGTPHPGLSAAVGLGTDASAARLAVDAGAYCAGLTGGRGRSGHGEQGQGGDRRGAHQGSEHAPDRVPQSRLHWGSCWYARFNGFSLRLGFDNRGVIADNDPVEQEEALKLNALLTHAVISHNALDIAEVVRQLLEEGWEIDPEDLAHIYASPILPHWISATASRR
ncbi:Tn3 family transposase [Streptomyces griseoflavus]|uniref:Tn3 family transposase n=1 Tax=Streptomyces griseoflavus TaxID=35619 RepID=UPI00382FA178